MKKNQTDTVVIGSGLTGLTSAYYLNKARKSFIVIDKAEKTGGVIKTSQRDGFIFEEGPNTGVIGNVSVVELFDELADCCEVELGNKDAAKRYILKKGKWHQLPSSLMTGITTPLFSFYDKIRILGELFRKKGDNPHENLSSFVRRRLGKSFLDYAIDPFILGIYAGDPNYIIPKYALPKLYNLEQEYGSLIGGSFKKQFAPKSALEKRVSRKVFSFKNGLSSLTDALYNKVGEEHFLLDINNIQVEKKDEEYLVSFTDKNGETNLIQTKKIISTVGAYELEKLFPFLNVEDIKKIDSLLYTKVIEVSLGFKQWKGMKLDGFGGLIPSAENRDILGVLFMSALFKNRAPEGGALVTIFMGGARRQDLIALSDEEIKKIVERECKDVLQIKDFNPDLFKITRHNKAIPQYGIESGIRFETIEKIEKENQGLFIGGNLRNGIGMADRIQQGKMLAEKE